MIAIRFAVSMFSEPERPPARSPGVVPVFRQGAASPLCTGCYRGHPIRSKTYLLSSQSDALDEEALDLVDDPPESELLGEDLGAAFVPSL